MPITEAQLLRIYPNASQILYGSRFLLLVGRIGLNNCAEDFHHE